MTLVTNPLNENWSYSYDAKGQLISKTDPNHNSTSYGYDTLGRLITRTTPDGQWNYSYDAAGDLTHADNYSGSVVAFGYDSLNRITVNQQTLPGGFSANIGYTYDSNGNRTAMTTPWGNFTYQYDTLNRLVRITNPQGKAFSFGYDARGRRIQLFYPNGIVASYSYNASGELSQVVHRRSADNSAIVFLNYTYDSVGNRTSMVDVEGTHSYGYDGLHRLVSASHPPASISPIKNETFSYDSVGNRLSDSQFANYVYDSADRLLSNSSYTYTFDADGDEIAKRNNMDHTQESIVYNANNAVAHISLRNGSVLSYTYDALGRRIETVIAANTQATTIRFVYDGENILAMLDAQNNLVAIFTNSMDLDDPLMIHLSSGTDYFVHEDGLGSVVAHSDSGGNLVEQISYQAYGRPLFTDLRGQPLVETQSFTGDPTAFGGRQWDSLAGFYYHRNRQTYDPDTGRFGQEDPFRPMNGQSTYAYVQNRPTRSIDPTGLQAVSPLRPGRPILIPPGGPRPSPPADPPAPPKPPETTPPTNPPAEPPDELPGRDPWGCWPDPDKKTPWVIALPPPQCTPSGHTWQPPPMKYCFWECIDADGLFKATTEVFPDEDCDNPAY